MADSDKDILITPNNNQTGEPEINFTGKNVDPITLKVLDDNTLSFQGSEGSLFSIDNNLTSGTIYSVNDVSGVPSISVDADGTVGIAPYNGSVGIRTDNPGANLEVNGDAKVVNGLGVGGSNPSEDYGLSVGGSMRLNGNLDVDSGSTVYTMKSLYLRGTGLNNNAAPVVLLNGVNLVDGYGRGLTLIILDKQTLTKQSRTTYDTYGSSTDSTNLGNALNGMTREQIGILVSYDAIENQVNNTLRYAANHMGLYKLAQTDTGSRRPYCAIFSGHPEQRGRNVVEVYESNSSSGVYATTFTWLFSDGTTQGAAWSGNNITNSLVSGETTDEYPDAKVDRYGRVCFGFNAAQMGNQQVNFRGRARFYNGQSAWFDDRSTIPNNPSTQKHQWIRCRDSSGGIFQISGRGGLMLASSDDGLVLANGDVGWSFDNGDINVDIEHTWLLSDFDIYMITDLQEGWSNSYYTWRWRNNGTTTSPSDETLKENIVPLTNCLEWVANSRCGVRYNFTGKSHTHIGYIAQDFQEDFPEIVMETDHGKHKGKLELDYTRIPAITMSAIKELNAKVDALQAEVDQLKSS